MAKQNRTTLKEYFETGDIPSQAQYADLIDSKLNLSETGTQTVAGNITVAGTISSSGDVISKDLYIDQYIKHTGDTNTHINFTDDRIRFDVGGISYLDLNDNTSAPHDITFNDGGNNVDFTIKGNTGNNPLFKTDASKNKIGMHGVGTPTADLHLGGDLKTNSHITASGNISASGDLYINDVFVKEGSKIYFDGTDTTPNTFIHKSGTSLDFKVNNSQRLILMNAETVFNNVNVRIGAESNPKDLHVTGNLLISGSQVDFTNLPTSDPNVAGRLYNDGGFLKISAG